MSGKFLNIIQAEVEIHLGASISWIALKSFTSCPAFASFAGMTDP
jgi:hypothetical protein